jgi:hypothetical protein
VQKKKNKIKAKGLDNILDDIDLPEKKLKFNIREL